MVLQHGAARSPSGRLRQVPSFPPPGLGACLKSCSTGSGGLSALQVYVDARSRSCSQSSESCVPAAPTGAAAEAAAAAAAAAGMEGEVEEMGVHGLEVGIDAFEAGGSGSACTSTLAEVGESSDITI